MADLALALRVIHGCVAQAYLCIVVAIATFLSPRWACAENRRSAPGGLRLLGWITVAAVFIQLIVGATMRHLGAGLAIPTFPAAWPNGALLPAVHNSLIDLNFTHTRFGALLVTILALALVAGTIRAAHGERRWILPACCLLALVLLQITLGILVVLHTKPPTLTTFHVLNGAVLLATALLLSLRLRRFAPPDALRQPAATSQLSTEVMA